MATTTYTQHPPIYYTVRSCVRWLFWTVLGFAIFAGLVRLSDAIYLRNADPVCNVNVARDFTWTWNGTAVPLTECRSPEDIVLNQNGTWEWYDSYIHG